jgi:hypothetical protein
MEEERDWIQLRLAETLHETLHVLTKIHQNE